MKYLNNYEKELLATILFNILGLKETNKEDFLNKFSFIDFNNVDRIFSILDEIGVLEESDVFNKWFIKVNNINDLSPHALEILYKHRYTEYDIIEKIHSKKRYISKILENSTYLWKDIIKYNPPEDVPLIIRFCDNHVIIHEDVDSIQILEDRKIAKFNNGKWSIIPPYPKFDFNPLSNKDRILDTATVTHWAEPNQEDINSYIKRFEPKVDWRYLDITAKDEDMELNLYKALLNAQLSMNDKAILYKDDLERKEKYELYSNILHDLMICLDTEKIISNQGE